MDETHELDKFTGALVGLAVGDAVGTANEFGRNISDNKIDDMIGGGAFHLKPGQWTDDTSMALCLAASLIINRRFNAEDQLSRYARWRNHGYLSSNGRCFDIGTTTSNSISRFLKTGDTHAEGGGSPANGSIMRLAPVPMFFAGDRRLAEIMSAESSWLTHSNYACRAGCAFLGGLTARLINSEDDKSVILTEAVHDDSWQLPLKLSDENVAEARHYQRLLRVTGGSFLDADPLMLSQAGSVWDTLEAALYTFAHTDNFRDGVLEITNRGNDSDTVAAVYGQIAGAYYGMTGIPAAWLDKLAQRVLIVDMAQALYDISTGEGGRVSNELIDKIK